jgi:hypothetical protein
METNVTCIEIVKNWLNDLKFNHINYIIIVIKIMIIKNINISKGVINGAIVVICNFYFQ